MAGLALGGPPLEVPVAVVNNEFPESPICEPHEHCALSDFSCNILDAMDKEMIYFKPYSDDSSALAAIESGDAWGYVSIPANYTDHMYSRIFKGMKADPEALSGSEIHLKRDGADYHISFYLRYMTMNSLDIFAKQLMKKCRLPPEIVSVPVVMDEPVYGERNPHFKEYIVPAILSISVVFLVILYSSTVYVNEKNAGMLNRLRISGLSKRTMFMSAILLQFGLMFVLFILTSCVAIFIFGLNVRGNFAWIFLLLTLQGFSAMALGNILGLLVENAVMTVQILILFMLASLILGGVIWPIQCMNQNVRWLGEFLPYSMSVDAIRSILIRGWDPWHKSVWPGFASMTAWTAIFIALLIYLSNKKR